MNADRFHAAVAAYAPIEAEYHEAFAGRKTEAERTNIAERLRPLAQELAAAGDELLGKALLAGVGADALVAPFRDQVEILEPGKAYTRAAHALASMCFKAKKSIGDRLARTPDARSTPPTTIPRADAARGRPDLGFDAIPKGRLSRWCQEHDSLVVNPEAKPAAQRLRLSVLLSLVANHAKRNQA